MAQRLWRSEIGQLLKDNILLSQHETDLRKEITSLADQVGLKTEYVDYFTLKLSKDLGASKSSLNTYILMADGVRGKDLIDYFEIARQETPAMFQAPSAPPPAPQPRESKSRRRAAERALARANHAALGEQESNPLTKNRAVYDALDAAAKRNAAKR